MVPWAGRIDRGIVRDTSGNEFNLPTHWDPPHAEHGFGFSSAWISLGSNRSRINMPIPYAPAYAEQTISLCGNRLTWSLEYFPNGCTLPAWVGFHPWFPKTIANGHECDLIFSPEKMLVRGVDGIPTGKLIDPPTPPWDDAFFGVSKSPKLKWGSCIQVEISSTAPWWVIYDEDPLAICVEPQTAPPNAANLGITGDKLIRATFDFTSSCSPLDTSATHPTPS